MHQKEKNLGNSVNVVFCNRKLETIRRAPYISVYRLRLIWDKIEKDIRVNYQVEGKGLSRWVGGGRVSKGEHGVYLTPVY